MAEAEFRKMLDLIKKDRLRESSVTEDNILRSSESDRARVVNFAAFRRLQQKAQVFPLDTNAAVRTRLTHSIEVSQLGRYIAQRVIENQEVNHFAYRELATFVNEIDTACLLHDIGNPPFGHLGEAAIRDWFASYDEKSNLFNDLRNFDGNPQGFRLISFLSGLDGFGLNLTCTLLLSVIKYPWSIDNNPVSDGKIGLFSSDKDYYNEACSKIPWTPGKKFPFVYLMEAADDIAYSMSDLEDGLEKKIISISDLETVFDKKLFPETGKILPFLYFKTHVINAAVAEAAKNFSKNLEAILNGDGIRLIDKNGENGQILSKVRDFSRSSIYSHEAAEQVELAGNSVISGILGHFKKLLDLNEADFEKIVNAAANSEKIDKRFDFHIRLLRRLPKAYRDKYKVVSRGDEKTRRAHLIVDFISGMTDDFALEFYQILEGIRIK